MRMSPRGWMVWLVAAGCWVAGWSQPARLIAGHGGGPSAEELAQQAPLIPGLGQLNHRVTTHVPLAQRYFDQGLRLVYAFNHNEATRSFKAAAAADPNCAMAPWGIALALGPNYNLPVDAERQQAAYEAIQRAKLLASGVSAHEQRYIEAMAQRFSADPAADRKQLDQKYVDAMRRLAESYPHDLDVATLFAAGAMELRPWDLWQRDGQPQPGTEEIVATLERVLKANPNHPGANHYYIHAVEASTAPERAVAAADRLGALMPAAGHLVHMPSHIYYRIGRYRDAVESNRQAVEVDKAYIERYKPQGPYPAMYYPHNVHFLWSSLCKEGRSAEALVAADQFAALVPLAAVKEMPMLEAFLWTKLVTLVRFGKWEQVLNEPEWPAEFVYAGAMRHYARAVALAEQGKLDAASDEANQLASILKSTAPDATVGVQGHSAQTVLGVAWHTAQGRIAAKQQRLSAAIEALREAVRLQDTLSYDEPPAWDYPVRQTLGAVLMVANQPAEAEAVYRADLRNHPHNGWSLFGLTASLRAQGREAEAAQSAKQFQSAWQRADVTLSSSQL